MIISIDTIFGVDVGFEVYPENEEIDPDINWVFVLNLFIIRIAFTSFK